MVSVEMLFRVQVLLDVIVQALFPIGIGDFYDTICKTKMKYILRRSGANENSMPGCFLMSRKSLLVTVAVCVLVIVDGCQLNARP